MIACKAERRRRRPRNGSAPTSHVSSSRLQTFTASVNPEEAARLADLSAATASRAERPGLVAQGVRERVLAAARSLGLLVTDILNPFHATLDRGVQDAADRHAYTVYLFNPDETPDKERRAPTTLRGDLSQGLPARRLQLAPQGQGAAGQPHVVGAVVGQPEDARVAVAGAAGVPDTELFEQQHPPPAPGQLVGRAAPDSARAQHNAVERLIQRAAPPHRQAGPAPCGPGAPSPPASSPRGACS